MQSCPRCGAPTQPGDLACPTCNEPLAPPRVFAARRLAPIAPPGAPAAGSGSNGARPAQPAASAHTGRHTHEHWGPGTWGSEQGRGFSANGRVPGSPPGWYPYQPPAPPGESYRTVLSILALIASCLLMLGGVGLVGVMVLLAFFGEGQDLALFNTLLMAALVALPGGAACLYHAIRALMRRRSAPFSLPAAWLWLGALVVAFAAGIALFASGQPSGPLALLEPLVLLCGLLPAFAILAFTQQRLEQQASWRRLVVALISGGTLGTLAAVVVELLISLQLAQLFHITAIDPASLNSDQLHNTSYLIAVLLLLAVGAPLAEETTKQLGGFFILPRVKSRSEAFLLGMAAGIGFNIVETSQYLGIAQADWVDVAIQRVGAGLIHGMGAAMAGLGWYYLFRGKTLGRSRWKIGALCLAYAYLQHALLNGGELLVALLFPSWQLTVFSLRLDAGTFFALLLYALIVAVLWRVTRWLRRAEPGSSSASATEGTALAAGAAGAAPAASSPYRWEGVANPSARISWAQQSFRAPQPDERSSPGGAQ